MISSFLKVTEPSENSQPESAEGTRKERVRLRKGRGQQGKERERGERERDNGAGGVEGRGSEEILHEEKTEGNGGVG